MEVQFKLNPSLLERQIEMLMELRRGWVEAMATPELTPMAMAPVSAGPGAYPEAGAMEEPCCAWSA